MTESQENDICNFIKENREKKKATGTKSVICNAGKINPKFEEKSLKTKLMWCYQFIKRNGFSIRRVSHIGQSIPEYMNTLKDSFVKEVILKRKKMNIPYDDDYTIINMDETPYYLIMGIDTTLEFTGKKNVDILSSGLNPYRVSVILAVVGNGLKLPSLLILKGEPWKTIEKELRGLPYVRDKSMFIYSQRDGWCTSYIFKEWIKEIFIPYEKEYCDKCLLILDKASGHISNESLSFLEQKNINFVLITAGMTPICQPLDIAVNKVFKDNVKLLFEKERLYLDRLNNQIKLKQARLNFVEYIYKVWYNDLIINKEIIVNGFKKEGIINIFYKASEEEKISNLYSFDLYNDLGNELKI